MNTASPAEMQSLLDDLYEKKNKRELDEYERGLFDTLSWIMDGSNKPEIE